MPSSIFGKAPMQKLILYAQHADGRKLYLPQWSVDGEIINTRKPTAAVSIDQKGTTFPKDSVWIRKPRGSGLQDGWKFVNQGKKSKSQVGENKGLVSSMMCQDSISTR
jgi:hypothetical protein